MKKIFILLFLMPFWTLGQDSTAFHSDLGTSKKPWTHLDFANDPDHFQFVIVTDRTGSPRKGVFEDAVKKINWLMPEFVMSVGDLIRGAKGADSVTLDKQWDEHFERIAPLKMPFFHLAGNHDIKANNQFQVAYWNKLFGAPFYSFIYKNVLFLGLFTNEGTQILSEEQIQHFKAVIEQYHDVRWTMVFMHHPLWRYPHNSNFDRLEAMLSDRPYTVFAGHQHQYHHSVHNEANHYVLATTGGGSPLLGNSFGTFDHITWVTMGDEGPVVANLRLDGILPHDVSNEETHQLTQQLIQSIGVETHVLVDSEEAFSKGTAFITYQNHSDEALHLKGKFYHSHHVVATPSSIKVEIPPLSSKTIEVSLKAIKPFNLKEKIRLEYNGTIGYKLEDYPDLKLSGNVAVPIKNANYKILPVTSVEFAGNFKVAMNPPLPGTVIRYSMDGTDPNFESLPYTEPFSITKSVEVKARLFTKDGQMKSNLSTLRAKSVKPGQGLIVEHYPYSLLAKATGSMPDFNRMTPVRISTTQELDPVRAHGGPEQFGLVYKGNIQLKESGNYSFKALSDDGIRLLIDGQEVLSDIVKHKAREASGEVKLKKGKHRIEIHYFQWKRAYVMDIEFTSPSGKTQKLDTHLLSFDQNTLSDENE